MSITSRHKRLIELLGEVGNFEINIYQIIISVDVREVRTALQKVIIVSRLYLKIIVEGSDLLKFLFTLAADDSTNQLTCFTGTTDNQALAILSQN